MSDLQNWVFIQEKIKQLRECTQGYFDDDEGNREQVIGILKDLTVNNQRRLIAYIDAIADEEDEDSDNFSIDQIEAVFRMPVVDPALYEEAEAEAEAHAKAQR